MDLGALLDVFAKLDWFETLDAVLRSGTPSRKFSVSRNAGWSGMAIETMLKQKGVKVWERGFTRDSLTFRVKSTQARWAEYLLLGHGIPVLSRPVDARNQTYVSGAPQGAPGLIREVCDAVCSIIRG